MSTKSGSKENFKDVKVSSLKNGFLAHFLAPEVTLICHHLTLKQLQQTDAKISVTDLSHCYYRKQLQIQLRLEIV